MNSLVNLESVMNQFTANAGSDTVFDFKNGDPLAATNIGSLRKEKDGRLHFAGANGHTQAAVVDRFVDGGRAFYEASKAGTAVDRLHAIGHLEDTYADKSNAHANIMAENQARMEASMAKMNAKKQQQLLVLLI